MDISTLLLDFRITSHCNLGCDLCFRNPGINDSSLSSALNVIERMYKIGFRRIGFTGGEPTSRADYIDLIEYAKQMGFMTYLSTVGHRFTIDHERLNSILDWVGIPIDGIDKLVNADIRSDKMSNQHRVVKNILSWLPNNNQINIKLTTVVSQANINILGDIVNWVENLPYKIQAWRFYQFCPLGVGKEKRDKLEINTELFLYKMNILEKQHPNMPISWATFEERDKANVVMEPNFDIIIPDGEKYTLLGNMLTDSPDKIIHSIFGNKEIMRKCENNRFWLENREYTA
ncbi:TPA: radical SAM protein [Enterobacter cloacae]|uniref:radical SAM protein n=1 Tax=Enterobacter cloacae complex TaxID=354276 RepID=UPI00073577EA|nr:MULTISPECIES: radical SAM protein [Enterobacter cloacae complex]KTI57445.1 radical SAM protein [Enterobacter cloacae subsp. cloacae]MBD9063274.1 radical SAM protein [Enterobacter cloacae]MCM7450294.1 radical SAM protein [Enterobacter cloacae]MDD7869755.1 radical SAM protein [Enterobacter cloacae complex sp. 2022EL-00981]MDW3563711.1 radical SAM protein [Enterobacter cloacae]